MKKPALITSTMLILLSSTCFAGGFYLGAGVGNTSFSAEINDIAERAQKIDENSTAWKIFGGVPLSEYFIIEGGYRNFGKVNSTIVGVEILNSTMDVEVETIVYGWDVEFMGRLQIAVFDIFAKGGLMFWNSDLKVFDETLKEESGTDIFWGVGAGAHLGVLGVRLEYESAAVLDIENLGVVSLSATLGF
jgi:hypothetical protein